MCLQARVSERSGSDLTLPHHPDSKSRSRCVSGCQNVTRNFAFARPPYRFDLPSKSSRPSYQLLSGCFGWADTKPVLKPQLPDYPCHNCPVALVLWSGRRQLALQAGNSGREETLVQASAFEAGWSQLSPQTQAL